MEGGRCAPEEHLVPVGINRAELAARLVSRESITLVVQRGAACLRGVACDDWGRPRAVVERGAAGGRWGSVWGIRCKGGG